jgi:hypothetical protein
MSRKLIRPGTIPSPKREDDTIVRKKVTINQKQMIITEYLSELGVTIYIGNQNVYCIDIQLYRNKYGIFTDIGNLTKIRWDEVCSLTHDFKKGSDTEMILNVAMKYIYETYPGVRFLSFNDLSTKECDNGTSVSLSAMKLFTDGRTWYEQHFHAMIDPQYSEVYDHMKLKADEIKRTMSWDQFQSFAVFNNMIPIDEIKELYESSSTWQLFLKAIKEKVNGDDKGRFCEWLSTKNWFDNFVQSKLRFNLMAVQFLIDISKFNIEYTIELMKGGRNKTLKKSLNRNRLRIL